MFEISKEHTSDKINSIEEKWSKSEKSNANSEVSAQEEYSKTTLQIQQIDSEKNSKYNELTNEINNENFTVSKNYFYYDSKTGKTIVTQNKNVIDSLISE